MNRTFAARSPAAAANAGSSPARTTTPISSTPASIASPAIAPSTVLGLPPAIDESLQWQGPLVRTRRRDHCLPDNHDGTEDANSVPGFTRTTRPYAIHVMHNARNPC